jgi:hypothetical protein
MDSADLVTRSCGVSKEYRYYVGSIQVRSADRVMKMGRGRLPEQFNENIRFMENREVSAK